MPYSQGKEIKREGKLARFKPPRYMRVTVGGVQTLAEVRHVSRATLDGPARGWCTPMRRAIRAERRTRRMRLRKLRGWR